MQLREIIEKNICNKHIFIILKHIFIIKNRRIELPKFLKGIKRGESWNVLIGTKKRKKERKLKTTKYLTRC